MEEERFQGYKNVTEEQIKKAEKNKKENTYEYIDLLKQIVENKAGEE